MKTLVLSAQPAGVSSPADLVPVPNRCWRGYLPATGMGAAVGQRDDRASLLGSVAVAPTARVAADFATTSLPFAGSVIAATAHAAVGMTAATAVAEALDATAPKQADKPADKRDDRPPFGVRPEAPPS
jgi:hypothetical protein